MINVGKCDQTDFRANCPGKWRRYFIEQLYREQVNRQMYNQADLDEYSKAKNNFSTKIRNP